MKFLRINMTLKTVSLEKIPEKYKKLGGRCLTSIMINDHVPAECDPLGKDNFLIFAPGLLSGTHLINTGRLSIGGKSPLTGGIKESNVGGTMANALSGHGIQAVIIEGKPSQEELYHLIIDTNGNAYLENATYNQGMRNYELVDCLLNKYGEKNAISSIGPAGEMMLSSSSIQTTTPDGKPSRSAARGGLGAVMGSKGLKALIVSRQGEKSKSIADPHAFSEVSKMFATAVKKDGWSGRILPEYGTASILANTNMSGALPTRNARQGSFDGADKINGDTLAEIIRKRGGKTTHKGCSKCIINCSNIYVDDSGKPVTSALEYETIWAMGAMLCIDNLDTIARLDFLCDDIGLDTMNTGTALAVAMDAGAISFGDGQAAIKMLEEVAQGTKIGRIIGNGPDAVGKHFNHTRVPAVKGQSIAGYDPRIIQGMGVTYATSPMGADHTAGFAGGADGQMDILMNSSKSSQIHMAAIDSIGLCMFAQSGGMDNLLKAISALTGKQFGNKEWHHLGILCLAAEIDFNSRAGLTKDQDRLPNMFYEEKLETFNESVSYPEEDIHTTLAEIRQFIKKNKT